MRSTGRTSPRFAAHLSRVVLFISDGYLVWPRTIGTRARSTGPVVLRTLLSILMIGAHRQLVRDSGLSSDSLRQMTSAMGSSTAHWCGRPSPHLASADEIDGARVPRIGRPPSFHFLFFYRWLPRLAPHLWQGRSIECFTDAAFGLDDRSARAIGARFRPLTRFFGANEQRHGVEHRPLVRPPKPPSGALGMRSTGRASLGLAALPPSIFRFFTGGYVVWPGTIGTRARSTRPVILPTLLSILIDRSARSNGAQFRSAQL